MVHRLKSPEYNMRRTQMNDANYKNLPRLNNTVNQETNTIKSFRSTNMSDFMSLNRNRNMSNMHSPKNQISNLFTILWLILTYSFQANGQAKSVINNVRLDYCKLMLIFFTDL